MIETDLLEVKRLHERGALHWRMIFRVSILIIYSIVFLGIASYHFFMDSLPFFLSIGIFSIGFLLGLLLISRMFGIHWDEERAVVASGNMNLFGFCMLILYIGIRLWFADVVNYALHPGAVKLSGLTFCFVAGIMLGRLFATIIAVRRVHAEAYAKAK